MFLMGIQEPELPGGSASVCCKIGSGLRTCCSIKNPQINPQPPPQTQIPCKTFNFYLAGFSVFRHCERLEKGKIRLPFLSRRSSLAGSGAGCQHNWLQPGAYVQNPNNSLAAFYIKPNGLRYYFIRAPANKRCRSVGPSSKLEIRSVGSPLAAQEWNEEFSAKEMRIEYIQRVAVLCWRWWRGGKMGIFMFLSHW